MTAAAGPVEPTGPVDGVAAPAERAVGHRRPRLVGPDATRAIALVGVVIMNYHGYLNGAGAASGPDSSLAGRWFDPWTGVLSTRFAATFVLVAGVGVSLLTESSRRDGDRRRIGEDRWRLVRRGVLLYLVGLVLDWIWPGTILFFYGAFFVVAAVLFTLRTRWLVLVGCAAAIGAASIQWWVTRRVRDGEPPWWLVAPDTLGTRSPRGLLLDTFVNGTHPLLPWLAFLCAGMVVGRHTELLRGGRHAWRLAAAGIAAVAVTYLANHVLTDGRAGDELWVTVWSTRPFDRGLLYTVGTLGSSLVALMVVSWATERHRDSAWVRVLCAAGRTTLTLYVAHVLVFRAVVDRAQWVRPTGLDTALALALSFWVVALAAAAVWQRTMGLGPLERVYRRFGG